MCGAEKDAAMSEKYGEKMRELESDLQWAAKLIIDMHNCTDLIAMCTLLGDNWERAVAILDRLNDGLIICNRCGQNIDSYDAKKFLLTETTRLKSELREMCEAVLHKDDDWHGNIWAQLVPSDGDTYSHFRCCHCFGTGWSASAIKHDEDCPVMKAAEILKGVRDE